ncbi:hypothetical protein BJ508DRAFT_414028 [Ascobolus immersus RN42]|uniref:F-box domain-containing protein n=1 Tax=Ascobolus immersus RN42 TaxID=1160509 RepID=A0A3N4I958_ASCIM|nr:hypothetical protein BJ508DRAFT_414028 [Ascobolus immersus RN42]
MAGITDLPAELLLEIFSYSPTIASTVNLALTCKHTYAVFNISKDKIVHKFVDRDAYNRYELAALDYFRPESTLLHPKQLQFFEENPQYFGTNFARYLWTGFARIDARLDPTPGKIGVKELWRLQHTREKMMAIAKTVVNEEEEDRNKRITLADFQLAFSVALYQLRALWEYPSTPTIKAFTEDCRKDPSLRIPVPMRSFGLDILFDHSICATIAEKDQLTTRTVAGKLDELREKIKNDNVDKEIYDVAPPFSFVKQFPCGACEEAECAEILADIKKNGRPDNDWGGELDMGYARIQYSMRYGERIYPSYKLYSYTVGWKETVKKDGTAGKKKRIEQDLTVHVPDFNKAGRYRQWQKVEIRKARARATAAAKKAEGKAKAIKKKNKSEEEEKESEAPKEPNQQSEKKTASVEMEEWERLEKEAVWRPDWEEYGERQYGDSPSYSEL